jgi:hypothetical protein
VDMRTEPHWPDRSARWRPSASATACGTEETQGLAARVPGAGNAGINGTTNSEFAQAGMTTAMPPLSATTSLGTVPGGSIGPNGLAPGASPGGSSVPSGLTGTITVPNARSGADCFYRCDFAIGNIRIPHDI